MITNVIVCEMNTTTNKQHHGGMEIFEEPTEVADVYSRTTSAHGVCISRFEKKSLEPEISTND